MSWTWRLERADGAVVGDVSVTDAGNVPEGGRFPSQSDAESWIGESWRGLLDRGVDAVSLFEDDRFVYGPMSLHPAE